MNATEVANLLDNPDCQIEARHIVAADGIELRVYSFKPNQPSTSRPVVLIPGWTSVMEGWAPLLSSWVEKREIHYIETREKRSAKITGKLR
ncbi:MAG: hypothetical protein QF612_06270, partial [Candidatus Thalassarchaeaceae archaeon]|nr:hypothetical protein [Candidatus Thalassarchaeaceae archaeon]